MAASNQLKENMAVYNSAEHKTEEPGRKDMPREEVESNMQKNLPKIKTLDTNPKKKSSFVITGVVVAKSGLDHGNEECDSLDDLDETCETHTEDVSSDILDLSKNTDIEPDPSSTEDVSPNLEEPPRDAALTLGTRITDMTSRFKVVKIESKEPFQRGRWTCLDFLDPPAEKADKVIEEVGSGNSSAASSIHYVHGVDDPAKNPLGPTVVHAEGPPIVEPQPVHPVVSQPALQNGEYTPAPMSQASKSTSNLGILTSQAHDTGGSVTLNQVPDSGMAASQSQSAVSSSLQSNAQPVPTPSKPTNLPPSHVPTSTPSQDYVPNTFQDQGKIVTQTTNGHVPSKSQPKQTPSTLEPHAPNAVPTPCQPSVPQPSQTTVQSDQKKPKEFIAQVKEFVSAPGPDYLPPGQDYLHAVTDYLKSGQDYLPPTQNDYQASTANDLSKVKETPSSLTIPVVQSQELAGSNKTHVSAPPTNIPPAQNPKISDLNGATKPIPPIVSVAPKSNTGSPNNESVQSTENQLMGNVEISSFQPVVEEPSKPVTGTVESGSVDSEDEKKGAAAAAATKPSAQPLTQTQSILAPPLLEMVVTMNAGNTSLSKEEGDER